MRYRQAMNNTIDVLTFLAYAATLGLFIGALLGGLALVLARPAYAGDEQVGTLLLRRAPDAAGTRAPLVSTETVLRSDGPIQRVRIVQAFRNPLGETQEGLYAFRLPENATLERLSVRIQGVDEGEEDDWEEYAPAAPGLALLSTEDAGPVARAITGIEPGETIVIEVEYCLVGRYDRGRSALRLLTQLQSRPLGVRRRRRLAASEYRSVPIGVEAAWRSAPASDRGESGAPWLWLLPVIALYVAVAFLS